ncbi:MAG: NADP-dependent phosphogluconate dehydrogenase [Planctomycetota bacterium]
MAQQFGVLGLAVMGQNLALNAESKGFTTAVFNRTAARTEEFMRGPGAGKNIQATYSHEEFCKALQPPRKILLMVKAGAAVDEQIELLKPHLERGDVVIDGGNSLYKDTERRSRELGREGILYIGTGISGGEEGALHGPCIMPGGQKKAYEAVETILTKIAAQVDDGPCCAYIGPGGAGHYVKMVHNGIEYGIMQILAEAYDLMKRVLGLSSEEIHKVFADWNELEMGGYLLEITRDIMAKKDEEFSGGALVEMVLDEAAQKGTGKWTSQDAFDVGVPIPTITIAVESRIMSAFREERIAAEKVIKIRGRTFKGDRAKAVNWLRDATYASIICSYAQGMALLRHASEEYGYKLNFAEIARIWKGGCIIRSRLLDPIKLAYKRKRKLANILVAPFFKRAVKKAQSGWRRAVRLGVEYGVPVAAISASLAYFDSYRTGRLPANLTQAQRDCFGAHTYRRIDREGVFHSRWQ